MTCILKRKEALKIISFTILGQASASIQILKLRLGMVLLLILIIGQNKSQTKVT